MQAFTNIRAFIIDMDGVLWHGPHAVPGLNEFFDTLNTLKIRFILATNNASLTPQQYVSKLAKMGVTVTQEQILTSGTATALYLSQQVNPQKTRVFVIGVDGATQPLLEHGFTLTGLYEVNNDKDTEQKGADIVVCGKDETLTWHKLATATLNISAGARFIGTNGDTTTTPPNCSRFGCTAQILPVNPSPKVLRMATSHSAPPTKTMERGSSKGRRSRDISPPAGAAWRAR